MLLWALYVLLYLQISNSCQTMGDQMEIDPDLYGSSPQPISHPLFAHREPPASLSSTKSFSYDGAWFTPVPHTASMRKGSKPSWIWAHGEELRDALMDAGHYRRLERRGVTGAPTTMRAPVRAAASLQHQSDVRERRRLPV